MDSAWYTNICRIKIEYFFLVQEIALLNNPSSLNSYKISSKSIFSILKKI